LSAKSAGVVQLDGQPEQLQQGARLPAGRVPVVQELPGAAALVPLCPGQVAWRFESAGRELEQAAVQAESAFAVPPAELQVSLRQEPQAAAQKQPEQPLERA
jgi:hypothetical protein